MGWERRCQLLEDQILACFVSLCHKINLHKYSHCQQTGNLKTLVWIHSWLQQKFYVRIGGCCAVGNPKNLLTAVNCHHVSQSRHSTKTCWRSDQLRKKESSPSPCAQQSLRRRNCWGWPAKLRNNSHKSGATETRCLERAIKHFTKDKVMVEREIAEIISYLACSLDGANCHF